MTNGRVYLQSNSAIQRPDVHKIKPHPIPENETLLRENSPIMTIARPNQNHTKKEFFHPKNTNSKYRL